MLLFFDLLGRLWENQVSLEDSKFQLKYDFLMDLDKILHFKIETDEWNFLVVVPLFQLLADLEQSSCHRNLKLWV